MVLLVVLVFSQVDFMIGSAIGPKGDEEVSKGFVGYSRKLSFFKKSEFFGCFWLKSPNCPDKEPDPS